MIICTGPGIHVRDPALVKPHEDVARMQLQVQWLDERLAKARREGWGDAMTASIVAERESTARWLKNSAVAGVVTAAAGSSALSGREEVG